MARAPAGHCRGFTGLCAIHADAFGQGRRADHGTSYPAWAFPPWLASGQYHISVTSTNHAHKLACAWRATGVQGWTIRQALPILQVYTTVFLHGAGQGHVFMPAFTFPPDAQPEADIVWDGLQGDVAVDTQGHHVTGAFQSPGLQLVGKDKKFALHDVSMRADVSTKRRLVSHSDTFVRVGSMAVTHRTNAQATWAVTGAELRATTATASGTLQAVADGQLATLRLADASYGSGTSHLELRRLHLPTLLSLLQELRGCNRTSKILPPSGCVCGFLVISLVCCQLSPGRVQNVY